jgi:hypothetical protein
MLELRPNCECCDKDLPPESTQAMICTFECTFCSTCAEDLLAFRCPNCGGNLVERPVRPQALLAANPASTRRVLKPEGCTATGARNAGGPPSS